METNERGKIAIAALCGFFSLWLIAAYDISLGNVDAGAVLAKKRTDADAGSVRGGPPAPSSWATTLRDLRRDHPACFSEDLFVTDPRFPDKKDLPMKRSIKYARVGRNVTRPVRYSHMCPEMKPRYNCAKKNEGDLAYGEAATDWKLNIVPHSMSKGKKELDDDAVCNLWEFIEDLRGPIGLADSMAGESGRGSKEGGRTFNIFFNGNSYLRQIFEALVCGFRGDITDQWMQQNAGFKGTLNETKSRKGKRYEISLIGKLVTPPNAGTGTCRPTTNTEFYEEGVELPLECKYNASAKEKYDDNIGMVEFGNRIKFYYLSRPSAHENITEIYHSILHLDPSDVDFLVFNAGQDKVYEDREKELVDIFRGDGIWQRKINWDLKLFKKEQSSASRYFGADNPWITKPPDGHPCMPGIPDDEVNLLLFLMLSGAGISVE